MKQTDNNLIARVNYVIRIAKVDLILSQNRIFKKIDWQSERLIKAINLIQ